MKKILLVTMIILALSFVLFAQKADKAGMEKHGMQMGKGDCPSGDCGPGKMEMRKEMMDELNLTKEQQKKLDGMRDDHMKYMNTKQAEMENLHIDKQNAIQAEQYDKVKQINKNISDLELVIANAMVDHRAAIMKELTPEQKAKMQEMMPSNPGVGKGMKNHKGMGKGKGHCMDDNKGPCTGDCK